jgi:hypothetical protein
VLLISGRTIGALSIITTGALGAAAEYEEE